MFYHHKVAVIIPAYRVEKWIQKVLLGIPNYIDQMIVVDDFSDDQTSQRVKELGEPRVILIRHEDNKGVGGAMKTGFQEAMKLGADICVKMDGDDQMDPVYLPALLYPLVKNECDYTKGNRFSFFSRNHSMPWIRRAGNQMLTFFNKFTSGYWHVFDPQNGYLAIRTNCLRRLPIARLDDTYFFENSMLIHLNTIEARVSDVCIPARYADEESSMSIGRVLKSFPWKLIKGFFYRIFYRYLYRDLSPVAVMLCFGSFLMIGGMLWGLRAWYQAHRLGVDITLGTLTLGLVPILLGFQLVLASLLQDVQQSIAGRRKLYDFSESELKAILGNISVAE